MTRKKTVRKKIDEEEDGPIGETPPFRKKGLLPFFFTALAAIVLIFGGIGYFWSKKDDSGQVKNESEATPPITDMRTVEQTATPIAKPTQEPAPTPIPTPTATATPTLLPTPTPVPTPEEVEEQTPSGMLVRSAYTVYKTTDIINLRIDATTESDIINGILAGTSLYCTGICQNGWIRVEYNGKIGYVSGDYVIEDNNLDEAILRERWLNVYERLSEHSAVNGIDCFSGKKEDFSKLEEYYTQTAERVENEFNSRDLSFKTENGCISIDDDPFRINWSCSFADQNTDEINTLLPDNYPIALGDSLDITLNKLGISRAFIDSLEKGDATTYVERDYSIYQNDQELDISVNEFDYTTDIFLQLEYKHMENTFMLTFGNYKDPTDQRLNSISFNLNDYSEHYATENSTRTIYDDELRSNAFYIWENIQYDDDFTLYVGYYENEDKSIGGYIFKKHEKNGPFMYEYSDGLVQTELSDQELVVPLSGRKITSSYKKTWEDGNSVYTATLEDGTMLIRNDQGDNYTLYPTDITQYSYWHEVLLKLDLLIL